MASMLAEIVGGMLGGVEGNAKKPVGFAPSVALDQTSLSSLPNPHTPVLSDYSGKSLLDFARILGITGAKRGYQEESGDFHLVQESRIVAGF